MVTFFSPHPSIFAIFVSLMCCKAEALWRWSNYLQSRNETGRPHVLINMDETNIKLVPQERGGHVSKGAYRLFVRGHPMGRIASLAAQRYSITHVAAICDRPDFQMLLPQVVIVGASQITEARLATLRSRAYPGVKNKRCERRPELRRQDLRDACTRGVFFCVISRQNLESEHTRQFRQSVTAFTCESSSRDEPTASLGNLPPPWKDEPTAPLQGAFSE